ncbi:MAG: histidine phosphatase family protein [Micrococcaceae bacterium]
MPDLFDTLGIESTRVLRIEADGGSRGNPGPAGYGTAVKDPKTGEILAKKAAYIGKTTNNVAEYQGLIAGLKLAQDIDSTAQIEVYMDSKLVVEQMSGRWKIKHEVMKKLAAKANTLTLGRKVSYHWVPRAENKIADALANEAMDAHARGEQWHDDSTIEKTTNHTETKTTTDIKSDTTTLVLVNVADIKTSQKTATVLKTFLNQQPQTLVSSPDEAALKTAAAFVDTFNLNIETNKQLAESNFTSWNGKTLAEIKTTAPDALKDWESKVTFKDEDSEETIQEFTTRIRRALSNIIHDNNKKTIVIITHPNVIRVAITDVLNVSDEIMWKLHITAGSISALRIWDEENSAVLALNSVTHIAS